MKILKHSKVSISDLKDLTDQYKFNSNLIALVYSHIPCVGSEVIRQKEYGDRNKKYHDCVEEEYLRVNLLVRIRNYRTFETKIYSNFSLNQSFSTKAEQEFKSGILRAYFTQETRNEFLGDQTVPICLR